MTAEDNQEIQSTAPLKQPRELFVEFAVVVLAMVVGTLLILPWSQHPLHLVAGFIIGALVGYRRRTSRLFMYFLLLSVVVLSGLVIDQ